MKPMDLEHARFVRDWSGFVHKWVRKTVIEHGGSDADAQDVQQAAYVGAWQGWLAFKALPAPEQTDTKARAIIARKVKDATQVHWAHLRGVPRDERQRGAGKRAKVLRETLERIANAGQGYGHQRVLAHTNALVAYQFLMVGLVHGQSGLVRPDTQMLRQEVKDRVGFAIQRLANPMDKLIYGYYFEHRTFKDIGAELDIHCPSELWRLHVEALHILRDEMLAFASVLSARNTGHTLDDEPIGGGPLL